MVTVIIFVVLDVQIMPFVQSTLSASMPLLDL